MAAPDSVGLFGLIGLLGIRLLGLVPFKSKIPPDTPGDGMRRLGVIGLLGLLGLWDPPLGATGAFGALGC